MASKGLGIQTILVLTAAVLFFGLIVTIYTESPLRDLIDEGADTVGDSTGHVIEVEGRCSDKHRRAGPFLPGNHPDPGGLKGRGALGEPGRRKHHRERSDRGAQRVPGVESAEGFLDPGTSSLNTTG